MLLGKRLRNPMKRTTSMTEFDLQQPSLRSTSITGATETEIERVIDANSDQQLVLGNEDGVRLYQQQQPSSHPHPFLSEISNYHPSCYNNSANQPKQLNQGQEIEAEQGSKIDQYLHREQQKQPQPEHMMMMRPVGRAIQRRHSADYGQTAMRRIDETCDNGSNFLRSCSLCDLRLVPGRDIYMYRGDTAFCSLECRQQQMSDDQKKSIRRPRPASSSTATATKAESKTGSSSSRRETSPSTTAGSASCQSQTVAAV